MELIDGHVANNARDRREERIRICTGMDEKAAAKDGTLCKGAIYGEDGPRNEVFVAPRVDVVVAAPGWVDR